METLTLPAKNPLNSIESKYRVKIEQSDNFPNRVLSQQNQRKRLKRAQNMEEAKEEKTMKEEESMCEHEITKNPTVSEQKIENKPDKQDQNVNKVISSGQIEIQTEKEDIDKPKKKKKWRKINPSELGFNISLFPRPVHTNNTSNEESENLFNKIEEEMDVLDSITEPHKRLIELEGNYRECVKYIRADKDRKNMKAHNQVKTKYCKNVLNNNGRKALYVKHRVYKLMEMDVQRLSYMPSPKRVKNIEKRDFAKGKNGYNINPSSNRPHQQNNKYRPAPAQCLAHTIHKDNLPSDFDTAVANLFMSLQHRDVTPEDYDLLLRLDERVAPKTVSENKLNSFRTDTVESNDNLEVCPICMEVYENGQVRKYLPCNHVFHSNCIDSWLKNSSMNCPVDNLPLDS